MTKITIFVRNQNILGFIADQHAGNGDDVGEIVCHGVSALTLTCVLSMEALAGLSEEEMSAEQSEAFLSIRIPEDAVSEKTDTIFRTMLVGLRAIEREYKSYINIETLEV
ncbi:MAG: ribosomal-processing cysteine protease Prp [Peptoniphilus sp.]|nr:ribosomal-processing cysteine protease Prp [Peptoniphilus sp.]MDD7363687.1 ribosomal-processing cysteine protease Prp [Bacillota bacterium]MDY6044072.1 ribosomal-processing cysteine protease Prp [Peptoniphilus sp.]